MVSQQGGKLCLFCQSKWECFCGSQVASGEKDRLRSGPEPAQLRHMVVPGIATDCSPGPVGAGSKSSLLGKVLWVVNVVEGTQPPALTLSGRALVA